MSSTCYKAPQYQSCSIPLLVLCLQLKYSPQLSVLKHCQCAFSWGERQVALQCKM